MKQLTINIPDYYYNTFMEYFKHIPEASLINESSYILEKNQIEELDQRAITPLNECLTIEESNKKLRNRS
ncbi:MAG: hypothetical protein SNJ77_12325 [Cytophagales bacterium]